MRILIYSKNYLDPRKERTLSQMIKVVEGIALSCQLNLTETDNLNTNSKHFHENYLIIWISAFEWI